MWCGQAPDPAGLAACCIFSCAIVAWAIAALGALAFSAGEHSRASIEDVLIVAFVACTLIFVLHIAPPLVAAVLAGAMAAHALLIAGFVAADALKLRPAAAARRRRPE